MTPVVADRLQKPGFSFTDARFGIPSRGEGKTLEAEIDEAIAEARAITAAKGETSRESAVAWDIVEELLSAAAHKREKEPKNAFERYCDANPSASEALMYDL